MLPRSATDYAGVATCTTDRPTYGAWLPAPSAPDVFCSSFKHWLATSRDHFNYIHDARRSLCGRTSEATKSGSANWGNPVWPAIYVIHVYDCPVAPAQRLVASGHSVGSKVKEDWRRWSEPVLPAIFLS